MNFDLGRREVTLSIKEFPSDVQAHLISTLDINGNISNEPKFREIIAENLSKLQGLTPKDARRLYLTITEGNLLPAAKDVEKNQFGLNFALNTYVFSGGPVVKEASIPGSKDFKYSSVQVAVPKETADKILEWSRKNIPDDITFSDEDAHGREDYPHITVKYGIHSPEATESIELLKNERSIRITLGKVSLFENKDKPYDVVKIEVSSDDLSRLNKKITDNLEVTDTHPIYKPHLTLSYIKKGTGAPFKGNSDFDGTEFTVTELEFSSKDKEIGPTSLPLVKKAAIDVDKALDEVGDKTTEEINRDTAFTWASRAMACYKLMHASKEEKKKDELNLRAEDFRHEALEHAALVGDASFAKEIHDIMESARSGAPLAKEGMPISSLEVAAASSQPPVETLSLDGRTYTIRVRESDTHKPIGNWTLDVSEEGSLIFRTNIVRWPGRDIDIIDSYVLTDDGSWADADSEDETSIAKFKEAFARATNKYEEWSISRGPKSEMMSSEEWAEYKKLHGIEKEAADGDSRHREEWSAYGKNLLRKLLLFKKALNQGPGGEISRKNKPDRDLLIAIDKAVKNLETFFPAVAIAPGDNTFTDWSHVSETPRWAKEGILFFPKAAPTFKELEKDLGDFSHILSNEWMQSPKEGENLLKEAEKRDRICAWCKKKMGELEIAPGASKHPTHGICPPCIKKMSPGAYDDLYGKGKGKGKKEGAFMPSLPGQPFWGQYGQGEDHSDYTYPLENLYPAHTSQPAGEPETEDYQDTSAEYAKIPGKRKPAGWLKMLLKKFMPVGQEALEKIAAERPSLTYRDPDLIVAPREVVFDVDVPVVPGSKQNFKCKLAALLTEGKAWKRPEVDSDVLYKDLSNKDFKSISADISQNKKVIYDVKFIEGTGGPDVTPGETVARIDATDFFKYPHKKQNVNSELLEWFTKKMSSPASKTYLPKLLDRVKKGAPESQRKDWETNLLRDVISGDYVAALAEVSEETEGKNIIRRKILDWWFFDLYASQKYEDILTIAKVHRLGDIDPKTRTWKPNKTADLYSDKAVGFMEKAIEMSGMNLKPATSDYAGQVATILYGSDEFPEGSSIEAKSKIIQKAGASFVEDFVKDKKAKKIKFAEQPYAVQLEAFRKLVSYKQDGENGLWAMWENKNIPTSIRKLVLQTLVGWYGTGGLWGDGTAKYVLPPEIKDEGKKNILTQALEEPELRQLAYALMVSEKLPYLPWTKDGKFVYDEKMKENVKDQPSRVIPAWLVTQISKEPHWEYRSIIINKILKELPSDLVTEEDPIEFDSEGKLLKEGKVVVAGEPIKGLERFINLALRDPSKDIRAVVRSHFKLPPEKVKATPKPVDKFIRQDKGNSAENYLFNAEGLISHREYDGATAQLALARKAPDAPKWTKEIDILEKKINDVAAASTEKRKELEKELEEGLEAIKNKHGDKFGKRLEDFTGLLDYAAHSFSNTDLPFSKLSIYRKIEVVNHVLKIPQIVDTFLKGPEKVEEVKVDQPELPLAPKEESVEWTDETDIFKQGGPLGHIELESRQPPTTWPMSNPQVGYGSAFPLGAKDDELLLKDVNQFIGRPRGRYKSDFSFWKWLLTPKDDEDVDEDEVVAESLQKIAAETTEAELLAKLKAGMDPLDNVLDLAETSNFHKVVDAAWEMIKNDKAAGASAEKILDVYVRWNDIDSLEKAVGDDSVWVGSAIARLVKLKQVDKLESLYDHVRPATQERMVLHLGELGDTSFLTKALNSESVGVQLQAVQWLIHHEQFDILKKHLDKEKDPKVVAEINKKLALADAVPFSQGLEQIKQEKSLDTDTIDKVTKSLINKATAAFTWWNFYPAMRDEVLKNRAAVPYYEWLRSQPDIDDDIKEVSVDLLGRDGKGYKGKLPTIEQGKEALEDLKNILKKLPDIEKELKWLRGWIEENEERYSKVKGNEKEMLRSRIDEYKKKLEEAEATSLSDIEFQVSNLEKLYNEALLRDQLIKGIKQSKSFQKEYPGKGSWTDYQAYLKTFEDLKDIPNGFSPTVEGLNFSEKSRAKLVWKYTEPLRRAYKDATSVVDRVNKAIDIPVPAEAEKLNNDLEKYQKLEIDWLKQMGAIEPHIIVDEEYYKLMPPVWTTPKAPSISPEYPKSLQLVPGGKIMKMRHDARNPFRGKIEQLEKDKKELFDKSFKEAVSKLSKDDKKLIEEGRKSQHQAEQILKKIKAQWPSILPPGYNISEGSEMGSLIKGDKFIEPMLQRRTLSKVHEEYDETRKELYERVKNMHKLSEEDPAYISLKKDVEDFRKRYSVPPMGDNPDMNARRQWHIDSGTGFDVVEPMDLPRVRDTKPLGEGDGARALTPEEKAYVDKWQTSWDEFGPYWPSSEEVKKPYPKSTWEWPGRKPPEDWIVPPRWNPPKDWPEEWKKKWPARKA